MSTGFKTHGDNIKDKELAKKIDLLMARAGKLIANLHSTTVVDYNADPVEFIYKFDSIIAAETYALQLQSLDSYKHQLRVDGDEIHELRSVADIQKSI